MSAANDVIDRTAKIVTDNVAIGKEMVDDIAKGNNNSSNSGNMTMFLIVIIILAMLGINILVNKRQL